MPKSDYDINWYYVRVKIRASYVLQVPAQNQEEAVREAYKMSIPVDRLDDVEKHATVSGPTYNEIMERWVRCHSNKKLVKKIETSVDRWVSSGS